MVIVFGDPKGLDVVTREIGGLNWFRENGGALLIAVDRNDRGRLADLKVRVGPEWYECSQWGLANAYRGDPRFLYIKTDKAPPHPIFAGLSRGLAAHYPCPLWLAPDCAFQVLCKYPDGHYRWPTGMGPLWDAPYIAGTKADSRPDQRVLIIPGHSLFMNGLVAQLDKPGRDCDNFLFAKNCVRWLTDDGQRKHVLFIVDGKVVTDLKLPLAPLPIPPVRFINQLLRTIEEDNLFNRWLIESLPKDRILRWVLGGGFVLLLVLGLARLLRGKLPLPLGPLLRRRVTDLQSAPPLIAQRRQAVLAHGNLWEAARTLARQCFEGDALRRPAAPPVAARGRAAERSRLNTLVGLLWQLAYGPPQTVRLPQFTALLQALTRVQTALAAGELLPWAAAPPRSDRPQPPRPAASAAGNP